MIYPQPECAQCRDGTRHKSTKICDHRHRDTLRVRPKPPAPGTTVMTTAELGPLVDAWQRLWNFRVLRADNCAGWRESFERITVREWSRQQDANDDHNDAHAIAERYKNLLEEALRQIEALEDRVG